MIRTIRSDELKPGDVLSTSGATIEQVVPSHHGLKVYLQARFDDGYLQVVTVDAEHIVHVWTPGEES